MDALFLGEKVEMRRERNNKNEFVHFSKKKQLKNTSEIQNINVNIKTKNKQHLKIPVIVLK